MCVLCKLQSEISEQEEILMKRFFTKLGSLLAYGMLTLSGSLLVRKNKTVSHIE